MPEEERNGLISRSNCISNAIKSRCSPDLVVGAPSSRPLLSFLTFLRRKKKQKHLTPPPTRTTTAPGPRRGRGGPRGRRPRRRPAEPPPPGPPPPVRRLAPPLGLGQEQAARAAVRRRPAHRVAGDGQGHRHARDGREAADHGGDVPRRRERDRGEKREGNIFFAFSGFFRVFDGIGKKKNSLFSFFSFISFSLAPPPTLPSLAPPSRSTKRSQARSSPL